MHTLWVIVGGFAVALIGLIAESLMLRRTRRKLPIRILVIGTRGKSSVVRLVHARLRSTGHRVLGKTTGSKPRILLPDGAEITIRRIGGASILEQKKILSRAARMSCDIVVIEGMAISPGIARVESLRMIQPTHVLLTNARVDHVELAGEVPIEVAASLAWAIPRGVPVYAPGFELADAGVRDALESTGGRLIAVGGNLGTQGDCLPAKGGLGEQEDASTSCWNPRQEMIVEAGHRQFVANSQVAEACCRDLDGHVSASAAISIKPVRSLPVDLRGDAGELMLLIDSENDTVILNAFSANDPLSTRLITTSVLASHPELSQRTMVGVFNVRRDRGDRTLLWISALRRGELPLEEIILIGDRAHRVAAARMVRHHSDVPAFALRERQADQLAQKLGIMYQRQLLLCFGNFAGIGQELTDVWRRTCDSYGR